MNPFSIPSLICLCTMPFLGTFVFAQNRKSQIHRLFLCITSAISYWAFTEFNLRQSSTYESAYFWTKAGCFRIILGSLLIHFMLAYIGRWKDYDKFKAFILIYLPGFLLSTLDISHGIISGTPVKEEWGWTTGIPSFPVFILLYFSWKISALLFVYKETAGYLKNAEPHERDSFRLFFNAIIFAVILGIASTLLSGILRPKFPEMSISIAMFFSMYLTYIIWKYNLFFTSSDTAENIIELMGDSLILTGSHNKIVRVNEALIRLSGYPEKELINENVTLLIEEIPDVQVCQEKNDRIFSKETTLISKNGQSIPVLVSQTVVCNKGNMPVMMVIIVKDLTFWYKSQKEFAQAEKLGSYELIIRGIVHDFNNLLTSISGHLALAGFSGTLPESLKKNISIAENATHIAANLTMQLSTYAKERDSHGTLCHIPEIIQESAELALKGSSIQFVFDSDKRVWPVYADRYKFVQVFVNLFINAREAMSRAGKITVRCVNYQSNKSEDSVIITIHDEGDGISADIMSRIFEPFFTTKQKGSGLGLSIVKNIIEDYKGTIAVESRNGMGTVFTIVLPKATDPIKPLIADVLINRRIPIKKMLVMDDDESVRLTFSVMLTRLGHHVEYAKNGSEAVETIVRANANNVPFDCVILDLTVVAGIGAEQVIKRILEIDPGLKTIVTSGHVIHPVIDDYKRHGFHGVIKKPFTITDVERALLLVFDTCPENTHSFETQLR